MLFDITVPQFIKMLDNMSAILDKAAQYADAKKFDVAVLLQSRLAPDQFNFTRQIQIMCDTAKLCAARLAGKEAPTHADTEVTLDELRTRLDSVRTYLDGFKAADFADASQRRITQPRWNGQYLSAAEYVIHHALPNFYFHFTTAYAILRHNGVDIGKKDYLGKLPFSH